MLGDRIALEFKSSDCVSEQHRGLKALREGGLVRDYAVVSMDPSRAGSTASRLLEVLPFRPLGRQTSRQIHDGDPYDEALLHHDSDLLHQRPPIGHAYTVAADVWPATSADRGREAFLLTGTGERPEIEDAAKAAVQRRWTSATRLPKFRDLWKHLDIHVDDYIRTTEKRHEDKVRSCSLSCSERRHL